MEITGQRERRNWSRESCKCWAGRHPPQARLGQCRVDDRTCHQKYLSTVSLPWKFRGSRGGWNETTPHRPFCTSNDVFIYYSKQADVRRKNHSLNKPKLLNETDRKGNRPRALCLDPSHHGKHSKREYKHAGGWGWGGQIKTLPVAEGHRAQAPKCPTFHPASLRAYGVEIPIQLRSTAG